MTTPTDPSRDQVPMIDRRRGLMMAAGIPAAALAATMVTRPAVADPGDAEQVAAPFAAVTIEELRGLADPYPQDHCWVSDPGQEGIFRVDRDDTTSADNGGTVLVSAAGERFTRVYSGALNVRWFGAKGDGEADDTDAIQAAIDIASRVAGAVYLPIGSYAISAPLLFRVGRAGTHMFGDSFSNGGSTSGSTILPHSSVTEESPLPALMTANDNALRYLELSHLSLVGAGRATDGIYIPKLVTGTFSRISVRSAIRDGLAFGYGFYNRVDDCRFFQNGRDGIRTIDSAINTFNLTKTVFLRNGHAGFNLDKAGGAIRVAGCSFEGHGATGVLVQGGSRTVEITECYFESNVEDGPGYSFDNPERTIRADVIVNGTGVQGAIGSEWPTGTVSLNNNYCAWGPEHTDHFVACYGSHTRLEIANTTFMANSKVTDSAATVLRTGTTRTGLGALAENISMVGNNVQFDRRERLALSQIEVDDLAGGHSELHDASIDTVIPVNYAPTLTELAEGVDTRLRRKVSVGERSYLRQPVVTLAPGAELSFEVDADQLSELSGSLVYLGCSIRSESDAELVLATSSLGDSDPFTAGTTWQKASYTDQFPADGVVSFTLRNSSSDPRAELEIGGLVLAPVGAPYRDMF